MRRLITLPGEMNSAADVVLNAPEVALFAPCQSRHQMSASLLSMSTDFGDGWGKGISLAPSVHERHSPAKLIGLVIGFDMPPRCSEISGSPGIVLGISLWTIYEMGQNKESVLRYQPVTGLLHITLRLLKDARRF